MALSHKRVALVTGASSGIGEACARRLVGNGWRVLAGVRKAGDAPEGTEEVLLDVTDEEQVREAVLRQLARYAHLSPLTTNALLVLLKRRRLSVLPAIARRLRTLSDEKNGVLRAKVTSAGSLPETYFRQLQASLERALGKRVIVEHDEDPALIGGVVARIGDNTFDGSISGRLDELEKKLLAAS